MATKQSTEVQTLIFDGDKFSVDEAKQWAREHDFTSSGVDETSESIRIRQREPNEFKEGSFRTIELDDGVDAVIGKPKGSAATTALFRKAGALALNPQAWGHEFAVLELMAPVERAPYSLEEGIAVVDIRGPLEHHESWQWDSYDAIRKRVDAAFDCPDARAVVLRIDSPGGDVDGCFELARDLRAMQERHDKPFWTYVDGMAASAAYALACATQWICVTPTAFVGSIGIIEALCDQTARDAAMGLRFAVVTSGTRKGDGNPHVPISKDAVASLQTTVDGLAELFFELVEELRGIPAETSRGLQARIEFGNRAVGKGLADEVSTWSGLIARSATTETKGSTMAKYLDDKMLASLRKAMSDGDEDEKQKAKRMIAAMLGIEEGPPDDAKPEKEQKQESKAEGEGEGEKRAEGEGEDEAKKRAAAEAAKAKAAKAEGEGEGEGEGEKKAKAAAIAANPEVFALAKRVQELEARHESTMRAQAVAELLAKRPDFSAEVKTTLSTMPIEKIREAVEKWPRVASSPSAAAGVVGTRGATQSGDATLDLRPEEADFIDRQMGLKAASGAIKRQGNHLELGPLSPEQARARLAELEKGAK